jgi:hypothetical protein
LGRALGRGRHGAHGYYSEQQDCQAIG